MPDVTLEHPSGYDAERRYIHDVVFREFLGLSYDSREGSGRRLRITRPGSDGAITLPDTFFQTPADAWLQPSSLPSLPLARVRREDGAAHGDLPLLFGDAGPLLQRTDGQLDCAVDVMGSAFFMLTRYEEAVAGSPRDNRGRFPDEAAIAVREGFNHRPIVNEYLALLDCALHTMWPALPRPQRTFRPRLTHDVDWPFATAGRTWPRVARQAALDVLQRHSVDQAALRWRSYRQTRRGDVSADMWNSFDFIMDSAERAGLRSAFYFIPERLAGKLDGSYTIEHPFIRRLLRQIDARGHELGIHTSYEANHNPALIQRQLERLSRVSAEEGVQQEVHGGRQHYLRWLNPESWQGWDSAGLAYDSSVGWVRHTGFRAGVCYEYPAFNLRTRRRLQLRERPLIAMEEAAMNEHGYRLEGAAEGIITLIRTVRCYHGDFVLLWHNNWLGTDAERLCFRTVLAELTEGRGW